MLGTTITKILRSFKVQTCITSMRSAFILLSVLKVAVTDAVRRLDHRVTDLVSIASSGIPYLFNR